MDITKKQIPLPFIFSLVLKSLHAAVLLGCGVLSNDGHIEELTKEGEKEEEEESHRQCLSKREFCGMTWSEAKVVKTNMMFHQSGSYEDICLSKQPVRQFKHHRHEHSADDSRVYSHNIWYVSHIQDCDIIFFLLSLSLLEHWLWIEKLTKTTHTSSSSISLDSERSSGQYS